MCDRHRLIGSSVVADSDSVWVGVFLSVTCRQYSRRKVRRATRCEIEDGGTLLPPPVTWPFPGLQPTVSLLLTTVPISQRHKTMNTASRSSASLLRCCRASTSGSSGSASRTSAPAVGTFALQPQHHPNGQIAALSTSARPCYPSTPLHKPPPSRHKTPKGTNAKPAAKGRPNRYDTTYGIPPLNPALYKRGPEKLDRNKFEKAQRPEWERIWKLEDEIATTASESKKAQLAEQLQQLKANQPWRHPLWAFFHEKSRTEYEEELREREQAGLTDDFPGAYSLAYSLEAPNKAEGTSGELALFFLALSTIWRGLA